MLSNYEIAVKEEMKKVMRCFERYGHEDRANKMASPRQGHRQKQATGEFYYVHPAAPDRAFPTRKQAAIAGLEAPEPSSRDTSENSK